MKELIKNILREEFLTEMPVKNTQDEFIIKAKEIHGDKYNYDKAFYVNYKTKLDIECPLHGFFSQNPAQHLRGQGCPICGREKSDKSRKLTQDEFIKRSKKVHGDTYDYTESIYEKESLPIKIICKKHGPFFQTPYNHYGNKQGCPICGRERAAEKSKKTSQQFIDDAKKVHNNFYDYSLVNYTRNKQPITIICPKHGEFKQIPTLHLAGQGCPKCANNVKKTNDEFIEDAKKIHGNKYDYSLAQYKNSKEPVTVICPKHGDFETLPINHLKGVGCPICSESKGEKLISLILEKNNISFERQKKFSGCFRMGKNNKRCYRLPFDFYLPDYNIVVEYDGIQHFKPINIFGGQKGFEQNQIRDELKTLYCQNNNIKIIRVPYTIKNSEIEPFIKKELGIK